MTVRQWYTYSIIRQCLHVQLYVSVHGVLEGAVFKTYLHARTYQQLDCGCLPVAFG